MKEEVIYLINLDWGWIKQRPHFIVKEIGERFNVRVFYQRRYRRGSLQHNNENTKEIKIYPIYVLPRIGEYPRLSRINTFIRNKKFKKAIKRFQPKVIITTYPDQIRAISENYKGVVVYDCMDDHVSFIKNAYLKRLIFKEEKELLNRADCIFATSNKLIENINEKYNFKDNNRITLVRNGYDGEIISTLSIEKSEFYKICYFGTVSEWFDFDIVMKSLNDFSNIQYYIIGPCDREVPLHERIHYLGTIEHSKLYDTVSSMDCFIMPFVINDIVLAVDPVKLYEYINFNKNIISIYYPEIERFKNFVHFYTNYDSYKNVIEGLLVDNSLSYSSEERISFLKDNSWKRRGETIILELAKRMDINAKKKNCDNSTICREN